MTNVLDESGWNVFLMVLRESFIWDWLITRSACNAVQSVHGHTLKRPPHQRMLLQDLAETVRAQRVQTAVGLSPHAGCASSLCQQANLWNKEDIILNMQFIPLAKWEDLKSWSPFTITSIYSYLIVEKIFISGKLSGQSSQEQTFQQIHQEARLCNAQRNTRATSQTAILS